MTIDIKSYAGETESPAAVEQQVLNQYQREMLDEGYPTPPPMSENTEIDTPAAIQTPSALETESLQDKNFRALSESVEKLRADREAERRDYQLQLDMLRANVNRTQQPDDPRSKQMFDGMEDSDIPTVGEFRKAWNEKESVYNERIEELQVANKYSDYADVLTKYGKQLAETDPLFIQGLRGAENKAMFAYQYAKREQRLHELENLVKTPQPQAAPQINADAQRMVENARKPGTLSQTGGQGAFSKADYIETMSDAEFMKFASRHMESI